MSELHEALLKVQMELKPVKRTSDNPFFKSKYADLEAVIECITPVFNKHGLVYSQTTATKENGSPILITKIVHAKTGEFIQSDFPIITKDSMDPQKVIAGLTYMRRASLSTIAGLAAQDDDGNEASKPSDVKQYKEIKSKPKVEGPEEAGARITVKILGAARDTETRVFSIQTSNGLMYTKNELLAQVARTNIGKSVPVRYTVDNNMETELLEVLV